VSKKRILPTKLSVLDHSSPTLIAKKTPWRSLQEPVRTFHHFPYQPVLGLAADRMFPPGRTKANSVKRRDTVHKPVEDERLQRLSEKLLEIAKSSKPSESTNPATKDVAMDVDENKSSTQAVSKKKATKGRIHRNRHARNAVVFPSLRKRVTKGKRKGTA